MTLATILPQPRTTYFDTNDNPLSGGEIYFYIPNTTTLSTTWQDALGSIPNTNPVILDGNGSALIYGSGQYFQIVYDSQGNEIYSGLTQDVYQLLTSSNNLFTGNNTFSGTNTFTGQVLFSTGLTGVTNGGFINKFRNGTFDIKQRGITGTIIASTPSYSADGWILNSTGANIVWSFSNTLSPPGYSVNQGLTITGATSVSDASISQRIESSIAAQLSGQVCTVQFSIFNNTGSVFTPTLTVTHATAVDNWGSSITDLNAVALQSCGVSTNTIVSYSFLCSTSAFNGLQIFLDFGSVLNANTKSVAVAGADIRATPAATVGVNNSFSIPELRPAPVELVFCQRYFNSTFGNGVAPAQNATVTNALYGQPYSTSAGAMYIYWEYPVQMRTKPTVTTYNPSAANANWRDVTGTSDVVVSVDPDTAGGVSGVLIASQTTALTAGHHCYIHASASSEL